VHILFIKKLWELLKDTCYIKNKITQEINSIINPISQDILEDILIKLCYIDEILEENSIKNLPLTWPKNPKINNENLNKNIKLEKKLIKNQINHHQSNNQKKYIPYPLSSILTLYIDHSILSKPANVLFTGDEENISISSMILDSLKKCPIDSRFELAQNMILTGGFSMMKGFKERLINELNFLIFKSPYEELKNLSNQFNFIYFPFPTNYLGWLGGFYI
jgi:actin-related protein